MQAGLTALVAFQGPGAGGRVLSRALPLSQGATAVSVVWGEGLARPTCTNPI